MTDRAAIIEELGECAFVLVNHFPEGYSRWAAEVCQDAIEALKERRPGRVHDIAIQSDGWKKGYCPACGMKLESFYNSHFCGTCGLEVKWE